MNPTLAGVLSAHSGVASRADFLGVGLSRQRVDRAIAQGDLVRTGRSALVSGDLWRQAAPWERHALRSRSAMRVLRTEPVALSHHSALSVLGVPVYAVDERVHFVRTDGRPPRTCGPWVRHPTVPGEFLIRRDGMRTVAASLASLQVADVFGVEAGLVSADAALRAGGTKVDLADALEGGRFGRGIAAARTVAEMADGRMESAGESRTRWLLRVCGLPSSQPQAVIRGRSGRTARVDFLFREQRTIVEFDGMLKYDNVQALRDEKQREDWLRELGYEVVRLTWADLANPGRVHSLVLAAFERAARLRVS
ncbi:MAG: DUF559 domain-containing protein [Ornithinimicrobium sp.]